jgi:hypothetical protein
MKFFFLLFCLSGCDTPIQDQNTSGKALTDDSSNHLIVESGKTLGERILPPAGFSRIAAIPHSFATYLRSIPLKPHNTPVRCFDGSLKTNQSAQAAVLDVSVGASDLQQCADAVMRLRADYLYNEKKYADIRFDFTNGFRAGYDIWRNGKSIQVKENRCSWVNASYANNSEVSYRLYLQKVFTFAGTLSLSRQLTPVANLNQIKAGDVWIRGGSPGHAVIVMDVAVDGQGKKVFLIAQSYMPAQDIHVLKNPANEDLSPWYAVDEIETELYTPEYTFHKSELSTW